MARKIYKRIPKWGMPLDEAWDLQATTGEEIKRVKQAYASTKKCEHLYVTFTPGWIFDECTCAICKYSLGSV